MKNLLKINIALVTAAFGFAACQTPTVTVNTNQANTTTNSINANSNSTSTNSTSANSNSMNSSAAIEANEPSQYQGTVTLKLEAGGTDKKTELPTISAQVARSGDNRRMEFALPSGEKIIYLDLGGKQFVVSPQRKQYAEIDKESVGMDVRRLLTPAQIVSQVKAIKGVQRVGEEMYNGRNAVKYQYSSTTDTKTKAGNVETNSVIYVDKETGLPLHSETSSASTDSSVNGINNLRLVTEMSNIQLAADEKLFAEPTEFQKVAPEQIRQQLDVLFKVAGTFIGQVIQNSSSANNSANSNTQPTGTPQ